MKIRYHGTKEVDLNPGDMFRFIHVSGLIGRGLFIRSVLEDPHRKIPRAEVIIDGIVSVVNLNMYFRLVKL